MLTDIKGVIYFYRKGLHFVDRCNIIRRVSKTDRKEVNNGEFERASPKARVNPKAGSGCAQCYTAYCGLLGTGEGQPAGKAY
jgi:hypothetical protein